MTHNQRAKRIPIDISLIDAVSLKPSLIHSIISLVRDKIFWRIPGRIGGKRRAEWRKSKLLALWAAIGEFNLATKSGPEKKAIEMWGNRKHLMYLLCIMSWINGSQKHRIDYAIKWSGQNVRSALLACRIMQNKRLSAPSSTSALRLFYAFALRFFARIFHFSNWYLLKTGRKNYVIFELFLRCLLASFRTRSPIECKSQKSDSASPRLDILMPSRPRCREERILKRNS